MAGQPLPPRLVEAFAKNAGAGFITSPFPVPSQQPTGAASLNDGFPPLCFLDPADGGVLPSGADFNAILNIISSWAAFLGAGQLPVYDATLQTVMGGYAIGARIQQAGNTSAVWVSTVNGNLTNPDTGGGGWLSSVPLYSTAALAGPNDVVLPGISDYIIDVDTSSAPITYTGFVAQRPWQKLTFSPTGANNLNLSSLTGSVGANQMRLATGGVGISQNDSYTIQYVPTLNKWVPV